MIDKVNWTNCCLCHSCGVSCPKNAIGFDVNHYDFMYPSIDPDKCINCGICESICPVLSNPFSVSENFPLAYGAHSREKDVRCNSTSGGLFYEAAKYIIDAGGYVCGAVFLQDFRVKHVITNQLETVLKMRGSKYSQSDFSEVYSQILPILNNQKPMLVCACPCQIAALRKYIKNVPNNLYLIELVCHGIPSEQILQDYICFMENKYKSKLVDLRFRDKTFGWHMSSVRMRFENGKQYIKPITVDAYMNGFLGGSTLKESCYHCQFKAGKSGCDLTLGDFWGAEKEIPEFDDNTGISSVLAYTEKGIQLLRSLSIDVFETSPDVVVRNNKNILEPTKKNPIRSSFFEYQQKYGPSKAFKLFFEEKPMALIKRKTRYTVRCMVNKMRGKEKPLY